MNKSEIILNELNFFAHYSKVFSVSDIAEYVDLNVESKFIRDILQRDPRFFTLGLDSGSNAHFISNNTLINWLIYLSVKLAKANRSHVSKKQFLNLSSSLGLTSKEASKFTPVIINFGRNWGLIGKAHKQSQFFLPIAHLASFLNRAHFTSIVESYPSRAIFKLILSLIDQKSTTTEESMMECIESVLSQLNPTEAYILTLRTGLAGTRMTLEEIAKEFGRTRERIRQIEVSARRRRVLVRP
ncbi:MAG: sigma factor-like helix-turn-helix DNA-binding protein, partial [Sedimentisphaerales bacterium]